MSDESERVILQVVPALVTGGVERGTIEMAIAIRGAGWKAMVASSGGPMVAQLDKLGITHITIPQLASKRPRDIINNIDLLADVINENDVNIVHARSRAPAWSAYFAARQTGVHFVTTFHNAYSGKTKLKILYNSVMAKGAIVIAISNYVAAYAKKTYKIPADRLRVIYRGVNIDQFDTKKVEMTRIVALREKWDVVEHQPLVIMPGRLTTWKGQLIFVHAIARLKRPDLTFLIVGSGNDAKYRRLVETTISKLNLGNHVRLVGECDDMPAAYCLAQIVVSASTRPEGFGRAITEAQAMGCAVIATKHGGAEETVLDGKTGWLITPGNSKILATALQKILAMPPDVLQKVGAQARSHIRANFTTVQMGEKTLAVYRELLDTVPPEPLPPYTVRFKNWVKSLFLKKPVQDDEDDDTIGP